MKSEEDEAFDDLAKKQGGGFQAKRRMAADKLQEPYDQTALELCNVCGWKTLIPGECCLNCERAQPAQEPVAWCWIGRKGWTEYGPIPHDTYPSKPLYAVPLPTQPAQEPTLQEQLDNSQALYVKAHEDWAKAVAALTELNTETNFFTVNTYLDKANTYVKKTCAYKEMVYSEIQRIKAKLKEKNNGT